MNNLQLLKWHKKATIYLEGGIAIIRKYPLRDANDLVMI